MSQSNDTLYQHGLVISYFGNSVAVENEKEQVFQCHLRRNQDLPVVGDKVVFKMDAQNNGVIEKIEPRQSSLFKGDDHGNIKVLAANIDVIVITMAPIPVFSEFLVDRYLVAAELLHIEPIIVMNKNDLLNDSTKEINQQALAPYRQIPYPALFSSALSNVGLMELSTILQNKSAVLVGPSGVGKSSIIAGLCSHDSIPIGEVSPKGAGKHTTTATRLYHMPNGGSLIDSPGVREFSLWPVSRNEIFQGFKEFKNITKSCKFRDCLHLVEPGCAVQEAVADGRISPKRFASYQQLMKEAKKSNHK